MTIRAFLMAMGLGAAATYLLDPDSGQERRKQLRRNFEKARKAGRKAKIEAGL
jgi:hypothetical protein